MRLHTWAYPWDVLNIGVKEALSELRDLGLDGIDLATNYHPITTLSPRAQQQRVLNTELGAVFFPARTKMYGRIQPAVWHDKNVLRAWTTIAEQSDALGLVLHSWTVGLFQPWIASQLPSCARVLPTGDAIGAVVCPSNPDVQTFLATMCVDIAEQFPVKIIQLEGVTLPRFDYGWVRPRLLMDLGPWATFLLGICFCDSCGQRARKQGLDPEGLRKRVVAELEKCFDADTDTDLIGPLEHFLGVWRDRDPDFGAYITIADNAALELISRISKDLSNSSSKCKLSVWAPNEVDGSRGLTVDQVAGLVGAINIARPRLIRGDLKGIRAITNAASPKIEITHFQPCSMPSLGWPNAIDLPEIQEEIQLATSLPVDRISIYNYGLLRKGQLRRLVHSIRAAV